MLLLLRLFSLSGFEYYLEHMKSFIVYIVERFGSGAKFQSRTPWPLWPGSGFCTITSIDTSTSIVITITITASDATIMTTTATTTTTTTAIMTSAIITTNYYSYCYFKSYLSSALLPKKEYTH